MKKTTILFALILGLCALPAGAQTLITTTTLSAALTNGLPMTTTITVASATGMAVNGTLWIEGSTYRITAVSGTTITVLNQTFPATHASGARVFVVPVGAQIGPNDPVGTCTRGGTGRFPLSAQFGLYFNTFNMHIAQCAGGAWQWVMNIIPVASTNPAQQ